MKLRSAFTAVILISTFGCDDASGPETLPTPEFHSLIYEVRLFGCRSDACEAPGHRVAAVSRGDTVWVHVLLQGASSEDRVQVQVRPVCAENVAIREADRTVAVLPAPITCPDSVYHRDVTQWPGVESRHWRWVVSPSLSPGLYEAEGRMLIEPALEARTMFEIR